MDLARAPRRARSNARKKGSGYENDLSSRCIESQAPMHNGPFGKRPNSIAVFRAQEAGTQEQSVV
jgi:hypothetical protein